MVRERLAPATAATPRSDRSPTVPSGSAVMSVPDTSPPSTARVAADLVIRPVAAERSRGGGSADADSSKRQTERVRSGDIRGRTPDSSTSRSLGTGSARVLSGAADSGPSDLSKSASASKLPAERVRAADLRGKIPDTTKRADPTISAKKPGDTAAPKLSVPGKLDRGKLPGDKSTPVIGKKPLPGLPGTPGGEVARPKPTVPGGKRLDLTPPVRTPFTERVQKGDLEKVAKGDVAQKVRLNEQYRLMQQGDVARRMGIARVHDGKKVTNVTNVTNVRNVTNVGRGGYYRPPHHVRPSHFIYFGWVSPFYYRSCFDFHYCGPSYYASFCWYPRWCPWVSWSWHYHCLPLWDPRPYWCRPIVYVPATTWVYYDVPVWQPLPEVASGTWVNVRKEVVPPQQFDLQLLAVRFVDPGHPEEKLGPRYRIWFRNNSDQAISRPFNVTLLASADGKLAANLPQAGARVASIAAGETRSVDVRLPIEVSQMGRGADGKPAPFVTLHVLVDSNREVNDVNRQNNGVAIAQAEILPVDPVAFEVEPTAVAAGGEVILAGEGLGPEPGKVLVHLGGLEMEAEILGWYDLGVRLNFPKMPLTSPMQAELIVVRGDGAATNPIQITVNPPAAGQPGGVPPPAAVPPPPPPPPSLPAPKLEPPKPPKLSTPPASY